MTGSGSCRDVLSRGVVSEPAKPGILDRLRARYAWFDHAMRANDWFDECQGNFFAAGLTYYTIFALFPLLMVGFSVAGFPAVPTARRAGRDRQQGPARGARRPGAADARPDELGDRRAGLGRRDRLGRRGVGRPELDEQSPGRVDRIVAADRRFARIHPHQVLRSGRDGVVVRGDFRHPRAQRAGRCGADGPIAAGAGCARPAGAGRRSCARSRCWCHFCCRGWCSAG